MAKIEVKMLGGFEIRVDGKPVLTALKHSRKATAVIAYLILRKGDPVSHKELIENLWAGERVTNPDMALRAIMHRFRLMVEEENNPALTYFIETSRGSYSWNYRLDCDVDVFIVEDYATRAKFEVDAEVRGKLLDTVLSLYTGRLLPIFSSQRWVESWSVKLHGLYRTSVHGRVELCRKWGETTHIVEICEHALDLDPYEERYYLAAISALETLGRHKEAEALTRRGTAMGCLHETTVPNQVKDAYRELRQSDRSAEAEIEKVTKYLPTAKDLEGAFVCSFDTFKDIYRVQRCVQVRYGLPIFLALVNVRPNHDITKPELAQMMRYLGDVIRKTLRQCDVAAQYSATQYVVMLTGSTAEDGKTPLERLQTAFYRDDESHRYMMSYVLYVPELSEDDGRQNRHPQPEEETEE